LRGLRYRPTPFLQTKFGLKALPDDVLEKEVANLYKKQKLDKTKDDKYYLVID